LVDDVRQRLIGCDAVLALIGPGWADERDQVCDRPASFDQDNAVHCVIEAALAIGIPVIPVLVGGGSLPRADAIPPQLHPLRYRKPSVLRDAKYKTDIRRLLARLTPRRLGRRVVRREQLWQTGQPASTNPTLPLILATAAGVGAISIVKPAPQPLQPVQVAEIETVSLEMVPVPVPDVSAADDAYTVEAGETLTFNPEHNDAHGQQGLLKLATINGKSIGVGDVVELAQGGTLKITDKVLEFVPGPSGDDEAFTYTIADGDGRSAQARVTIRVSSSQATPTERPGRTFRDCPVCPEMVVVPGGEFLMGSPPDETGRYDDEGPQRRVQIKSFAAGKHEVTWAEYDVCVSAGACSPPRDDGFGKGGRPVTHVSWDDVQVYARWLSASTGMPYRLLSEAEWEYAARAGTETAFSVGRTIAASEANFDARRVYLDGEPGEHRAGTLPVGFFPGNAFGLYDMHGNVLEWIEDCYAPDYSAGQPSNGEPYSPPTCAYRLARGGSWFN
jgi:formylglycine-generating enzyme required for sulfatase activity